jgi:tetratricopeptide (TPR) repeat protein
VSGQLAGKRVAAFLAGDCCLVRFDRWTYVIGAAAVAAAVVLGALSGAGPGVLAALAGLVSAALWQVASGRRARDRARGELLDDAGRRLARPEARPATSGGGSGSFAGLLRPEAAVVSFWPRPELAVLRDWLVSSGHSGVRLVTGEGGTGKTRLALRLGQEAGEQYGWRVYWVPGGQEGQAARAAAAGTSPVLLVADYAETRAGLADLLAAAGGDGAGPKVRVLLLARSAGEWWEQLIAGSGSALSETLAAVSPLTLGSLRGPGGPDEVFRHAVAAFAAALGAGCPAGARLPSVGPDPVVLVIHAAALLAVLDHRGDGEPDGGGAGPGEVITALLRHEARYWQQSQHQYGLALLPAVTRRVVAAGTLAGAADEAAAAAMLAAIGDLPDPAVRGRAAWWLHDLYPPAGTGADAGEWIAPLRPDLVAENLVVSVLRGHPELTRALAAGLTGPRASRALTLLARAALTDPAAGPLLDIALRTSPGHLAVPALAVAVETNPALGDQIATILHDSDWPPELLRQIAGALPDASVALAATAALVFQRLTDASAGDPEEHARNLVGLSNRLGDLGRREDALAAIEEAVTIRRELAAARPGAFLPDLAASLTNQSGRLSELGRREDALAAVEEAVTIRRELAAARPDAFLPDLATSLNNQSVFLSELGRREEALAAIEQAVTAYRALAEARPDAFLPGLAMSLNNQSGCLSELGRREDALAAIEEAVTIRRELASARPAVYLARLISSLNVLADALSALGRDAEAEAARAEAAGLE